ncbi:MAG TPA: hypothetical protein VK750_01535 [Cytophagaceae bacterium]|jgi:hypothetical protein|nr:hypothetical protein [Cytophagaceae bacterium]
MLGIESLTYAQSVDVEDTYNSIKNKEFVKVHGGASASLIYHDGNRPDTGRLPLTYNLNGNLNFTFLKGFSMPVSYNLTNMGGAYSYPTFGNRLSLHPTYKWVTGHVGDFTMSFSPYTFNGHMVRGAGVDVTIEKKVKVSAFYGILNQAVQYDSTNRTLPAVYKRIGYGLNALYNNGKSTAGVSYFIGKDQLSSIQQPPDSLRIYPKENVALGLKLGQRINSNLLVEGEYGLSITTEDARINDGSVRTLNVLNQVHINQSSDQRSAYKLRGSYTFLKNTIGLGYERVAPGYQTMGAYYFNNDFENFTVDYARMFFKGKTQFSAKGGLQRDNLDKSKAGTTQRYIGSAQISTPIGKKIQFSINYSNFQNYMRVRNQFDNINQSLPRPPSDSLNYIQINNNVNTNITYSLERSKERIQNILMNVNFQKSSNKQNGVALASAGIIMYNGMLGYNLNLVKQRISTTASFNTTVTQTQINTVYYGPTVTVNKRLVKDQLLVGISTSYNRAESNGSLQSQIINIRSNIGFTYKKRHTLNQSCLYQFRSQTTLGTTDGDFTGTITYAFNF